LDQFFNLLKRGGKLKKIEIVQCFILDYTFFPFFLCISKKNGKKNKKKKKKNLEAML